MFMFFIFKKAVARRKMQTTVKACGLNSLLRFYNNLYLSAFSSFINIIGQPDLIISF